MDHVATTQTDKQRRALVIVRGGVAEVLADDSVDIFLLDYDNDPEGRIPVRFLDLVSGQ